VATLTNEPKERTQSWRTGTKPYWLNWFLGETRTRILLLYLVLMLLIAGASVPIFLVLLFAKVNERVQFDLNREMQEFRSAYRQWEHEEVRTDLELQQFLQNYLVRQVPEDDNFLIVAVGDRFYQSNPVSLPAVLQADAPLAQRWINVGRAIAGREDSDDPDIGSILYIAQPIVLRGKIQGAFVVVHNTAGEQEEAIDVVVIFVQVALGVVVVASVIAWFATARILAPVKQLATTARSISESDLTQRLPIIEGVGEMAELATTFNAMMGRLQDAFVSQRSFINDAGHELRTPITIIQGHLELMGDSPQEQQETLALVMDELDRMSRMVNDLILLTKAERPDFLQRELIEVSAWMEELFAKVQTLAPRNWQLKCLGSGQIMGDRQRLTGALLNLVQNAVHYTQPTDVIEIGSSVGQKETRLWVRDTGEGIAPSDQPRIFERFARAANSQRRSDGAGLGLAIVRAIAEAHGGRVELVSAVGIGSTFALIIPLDPLMTRLFS
jgi:signal transduction histidine kinase